MVPPQHWRHCPCRDNPAGILSRSAGTMTVSESFWLQSPHWLHSADCLPGSGDSPVETTIPDDCHPEMKRKDPTMSLIAVETCKPRVCCTIDPDRYSSSDCLFRVTAAVLRCISYLHKRVGHARSPSTSIDSPTRSDLAQARLYWIKDSQHYLQEDRRSLPGGGNLVSLWMEEGCGNAVEECPSHAFLRHSRIRFSWIRGITWQH